MKLLLEFGRKAMLYVRIMSGYEQRRIRNHRLQLEKRLSEAQARKAALGKIPEQIILSEVRRMVEEMQNLNKNLEETEAAIEDYFKPLDKEAQIIMKMQLDSEEKSMKGMMKTMQAQASLQKAEEERNINANHTDKNQDSQDKESITKQDDK